VTVILCTSSGPPADPGHRRHFCKVMAWYNNELAYARRLVDVALHVGRSLRTQ
jgi:glyceraldehyde-3-phosphate dehydrogenase/erythrose-4-phosphate dehydrogenase